MLQSRIVAHFQEADTYSKGYPDEWFPSVSSTIGDRYPERSVFQVFIAMTSGTPTLRPPLEPRSLTYEL